MAYDSVEKRKAYYQKRYERRIAEAKEHLGGVCVRCGSVDELEFDHIDPSTKVKKICEMYMHSAAKFWAEVEKCQLLCKPCHEIKTREDAEAELARYNAGQ